jgi:PAS domain S-box-containing protein
MHNYNEALIAAGILKDQVYGGLMPSKFAKRLQYTDKKMTVTDGPFTETKVVGLRAVEVKSFDEALEWPESARDDGLHGRNASVFCPEMFDPKWDQLDTRQPGVAPTPGLQHLGVVEYGVAMPGSTMPAGPPAVITKMPDASHRRERAFLDEKEVYRQILDAIADMVLVKGAGSRILWANKAFRDYYGMTNELLYERVDAIFNQSDYTEQYVRDDHYVFTSGQVLNIPDEPVTRSDGLVQTFHSVKSPLRDDEGRVLMTVGVSRNITESKLIKEDLARYREHLEHMVEVRTDELSRLSDELSIILSSLIEGIVAVDAARARTAHEPGRQGVARHRAGRGVDKSISELIDFLPEHVDPHAPARRVLRRCCQRADHHRPSSYSAGRATAGLNAGRATKARSRLERHSPRAA